MKAFLLSLFIGLAVAQTFNYDIVNSPKNFSSSICVKAELGIATLSACVYTMYNPCDNLINIDGTFNGDQLPGFPQKHSLKDRDSLLLPLDVDYYGNTCSINMTFFDFTEGTTYLQGNISYVGSCTFGGKDMDVPFTNAGEMMLGSDVDCGVHTNCNECASDFCGWCSSSNTCQAAQCYCKDPDEDFLSSADACNDDTSASSTLYPILTLIPLVSLFLRF